MYLFGCGCGKKRAAVREGKQVTRPAVQPPQPVQPAPSTPIPPQQQNGYQNQGR